MAAMLRPVPVLKLSATAASVGLHAALALAAWRAGSGPDAPRPHATVILSLAAPGPARVASALPVPAAAAPAEGSAAVVTPLPPDSRAAPTEAPDPVPPPPVAVAEAPSTATSSRATATVDLPPVPPSDARAPAVDPRSEVLADAAETADAGDPADTLVPAASPAEPVAAVADETAPVRNTPATPGDPAASVPSPEPSSAVPVRARDAEVASLEALPIPAERIRGFVDRYDGGRCFFASVVRTTPAGVSIDSFSSSVEQVMAFHAAFMGQVGIEPEVVGQRVWSGQCPAVEFLRRTRPSGPDPLAVDLDRRTLSGGDVLSGTVRGTGGRQVALYLVSETGAVEDLSAALKDRGDAKSFAVPIRHDGTGGPFPEMIVATATTPTGRPDAANRPRLLPDLMAQSAAGSTPEISSAARLVLLR